MIRGFFRIVWTLIKYALIAFALLTIIALVCTFKNDDEKQSTASKPSTVVSTSQATKSTTKPTLKPTAKPTATPVPIPKTNPILYKDSNITVTATGDIELDMFGTLEIGIIVENKSSKNINVSFDNVCCNDWTLSSLAVTSVPAQKKARDTISFYDADEDAGIDSIYDIKTIEMDLSYYDSDTWKDLIKPVHITMNYQ